jgi:hypothetical protein
MMAICRLSSWRASSLLPIGPNGGDDLYMHPCLCVEERRGRGHHRISNPKGPTETVEASPGSEKCRCRGIDRSYH